MQRIQNSKLRDSELNELRSRVSKLEQKQLKNNIVHRLKDGDDSFENVNVPDPAINQCIDTNTNLLEDKEMIDFLDEKNKEKVSNEIRQRIKERKLLRESDKDQFQDLFSDNYNISSDISCNTEITNEQDSLSVSHIISTNDLCKLKKEEALIQEISLEKNYTNENLSSDREKKPRFQDLSSNNNSLETNPKDLTEVSKEETKTRGYDSSNLNVPEISSESKLPTNLLLNQKIPYNQKVERGLRLELFICTKDNNHNINKVFDIQIPEFSLEAILTESGKVTSQNIVDLFRVAMKVCKRKVCAGIVIIKHTNIELSLRILMTNRQER